MKKTIFISLSLVIMSLAVLPLFAEKKGKENGNGAGMRKPFMHFNMMQDKLGLTNDQVDKMYKIEKDYMDKFYQNRNNPDKIEELRNKRSEEIKSVFTPEQNVKWNNFIKDREKGGKDGKKAAQGPQKGVHGCRMEMMQKKLGLSDEQSDKIFAIHKDYMDKFYQNRNNDDKIKELHAKFAGEIENVLTPEQKTKWDELKKNRPKPDNRKDNKKDNPKDNKKDNPKDKPKDNKNKK